MLFGLLSLWVRSFGLFFVFGWFWVWCWSFWGNVICSRFDCWVLCCFCGWAMLLCACFVVSGLLWITSLLAGWEFAISRFVVVGVACYFWFPKALGFGFSGVFVTLNFRVFWV